MHEITQVKEIRIKPENIGDVVSAMEAMGFLQDGVYFHVRNPEEGTPLWNPRGLTFHSTASVVAVTDGSRFPARAAYEPQEYVPVARINDSTFDLLNGDYFGDKHESIERRLAPYLA